MAGLGLSAGVFNLPDLPEEAWGGENAEYAAPEPEARRAPKLAPQDALPYLFWLD
ncbi:MAG TPA: hypothetical protein VF104_06045 [Burkholderiales bacterium]